MLRFSMKVKVFFGADADRLTKEIQEWLDAHGAIAVAAVGQSQGTNQRTNEQGIFVTVFCK